MSSCCRPGNDDDPKDASPSSEQTDRDGSMVGRKHDARDHECVSWLEAILHARRAAFGESDKDHSIRSRCRGSSTEAVVVEIPEDGCCRTGPQCGSADGDRRTGRHLARRRCAPCKRAECCDHKTAACEMTR